MKFQLELQRVSLKINLILHFRSSLLKSLSDDLESDLSGTFETLSVMLTHDVIKFLTIELHETMARPGTDEASLTEVMISRSNREIIDIGTFFSSCTYSKLDWMSSLCVFSQSCYVS